MQDKPGDGRQQQPKDSPGDTWVVRVLKFFDRHNGSFNAFAAIAVAFFTWRLWRLSVKEIDALGQQSADVARSIAEAARSANAMEKVAGSMEISAAAAKESVAALKERTAQQMRAYITVLVGGALYQNREGGLRFQGDPIILNTGYTPAHKVRFRIKAEVLDLNANPNFAFPLDGEEKGGATLNSQQSRTISAFVPAFIPDQDVELVKVGVGRGLVVWGEITYEDIFGEPRVTRFGLIYSWRQDGQIFGHYTRDHNDAD